MSRFTHASADAAERIQSFKSIPKALEAAEVDINDVAAVAQVLTNKLKENSVSAREAVTFTYGFFTGLEYATV